MLKIGNFEIFLLNDANTLVDGGGAFGLVPRKLWARYFTPDAENNIPMSQHCLYVRAHGKHLIIDTGLGTKLEDKHRRVWQLSEDNGLLRGLERLGVSPEEIDIVIDTHLHADHCGGNTRYADETHTAVVATFPNAVYYVQKAEYEDAMRPNERTSATYLPINYAPLYESGQLRLLEGDTDILGGVRGVVTRGHTRAHMSVLLESEGEQALFVCDMASYAVHFERLGWMTAYDVEPLYTLESKRKWQAWAMDTGAILIFPHDPIRKMARYARDENGQMRFVPLDVAYD